MALRLTPVLIFLCLKKCIKVCHSGKNYNFLQNRTLQSCLYVMEHSVQKVHNLGKYLKSLQLQCVSSRRNLEVVDHSTLNETDCNDCSTVLKWSWLYRIPKRSKCRESTGTELHLCFVYFSLTWTVSTSPNLAKARARRASNDRRATRSLFS